MRHKSKSLFSASAPLLFTAIALILSFALIAPVTAQQHDDRAVVRTILDKNGMKDTKVDDVVEFSRDGRVIVLNLNRRGISGVGIGVFPTEIFKLTALRGLFLRGNSLKEIPQEIGSLTELIELNIADNTDLGKLPSGIGGLRSLRKLDIRFCGLTDLPPEIGNLRNLEFLQMWGNGFIELPYSVTELTKLRELYLNDNKLTKLPYDIIKMDNLKYIDVQRNFLCDVLPEVDAWLMSINRMYKAYQFCENVKR